MERGSDKHNQMLDDVMRKESESLERSTPVSPRVEEHRQIESASGEDQPELEPHLTHSEPPDRAGMSDAEVEMRSEIARCVEPSLFPAERDSLVESARRMQAPERVVSRLASLPEDRVFENVQDVWEALGGNVEQRY